MRILLAGMNHRSAPVEVRERFAVGDPGPILEKLKACEEIDEAVLMSRRLGNRLGVLPPTVLLDGQGRVLESRIGMYSERDLDSRLAAITGK